MHIEIGDWKTLSHDASRVRYEVFVIEQNVPADIELDVHDAECIHAVAYDESDRPVGTGRLLPDTHIGRMAVLQAYRGQGVGSLLLDQLIHEARRRGYAQVVLSAQTHALPFYERHGFIAEGPLYMDAGIEHKLMRLPLAV